MSDQGANQNAIEPRVWISSIQLSDDTVVTLPRGGVTAVVGGNNVGKSTLLRQMSEWLTNDKNYEQQRLTQGHYILLKNLQLAKEGTFEDFQEWLERNSVYQRKNPTNPATMTEGYVRAGATPIHINQVAQAWNSIESNHINQIAGFVLNYAGAGSRAGSNFIAGRRQRPGLPPTEMLHHLEDSAELQHRLDSQYFEIFGQNLTLDKLGNQVSLRVGKPSESVKPPGYYDDEIPFMEELEKLEHLGSQGDGMRALMSLLLPVVTATHHIIIVDEPEAFLHPPQVVKLGAILGRLAHQVDVQIIVATHDRNILVGLLDSGAPLSVVRLNRDGKITKTKKLEPEKITEIWSDPVLRYSGVLDGLFHRLVVAAEDDSDCTFYAAALDAAHQKTPLPFPPSEVLFVPTGGKDGMHTVVSALKALDVPVVVTPDIDILDDSVKMQRLVTALHGQWENFREDYQVCIRQFQQQKHQILASDVLNGVIALMENVKNTDPTRKWDEGLKRQVLALTKASENPWEELKKHGIRAFNPSVDTKAISLLDRLDQIGLIAVREGTMEAFAKGYGVDVRKGRGWLAEALKKKVHQDEKVLAHVRRFVGITRVN
jgi:ABC-type cobalamin/Fe3+-siderophores transport system ATPase subunit